MNAPLLVATTLVASLAVVAPAAAANPNQTFTYFESFENAAENTSADPRDINGNGIIDCGQDGDCTTITPCDSSPMLCDEWTIPLVADPNLKLANEATPATRTGIVYFKTGETNLPDARGRAMVTSPGSFEVCPSDQDNAALPNGVLPDTLDWHVHTRLTPDIDGTDTTKAGTQPKAFRGQNSLHWGRHVQVVEQKNRGRGQGKGRQPNVFFGDTYCLQCQNAFVLDREGGLNLGSRGGSQAGLSFWHIAEFCDEDCFAGFEPDTADEIGIVEVRSAALGTDAFGTWERVMPNLNPYDGVQDTAYTTPTYEPIDDTNPDAPAGVDPSVTMCSPLTVYVAQGSAKGTDAACGDGDGNGFGDCGNVTADVARGEAGVGVWARSAFDLSRYAGRRVQVRFIATTLDGDDQFISYLETGSGPFNSPAASFDDGWYVDDIRVSGLAD
jgi:hypothetical protein